MASGSSHDAETTNRALLEQWKRDVLQPKGSKTERPNYFYRAPESLITSTSKPTFFTGSGDGVFARVLPQLEAVESELVIVTCFWAKSSSLDCLYETLRNISTRAVQNGKKIKVFIGLSSVSLWQKLFHTSSLAGHTYKSSEWHSKLSLPSLKELKGLDLTVKSIFIRPFSVMHPKFIILDRKQVWLPSCNVSWETWFEGCAEFSGPMVDKFVQFWESFWVSSPSRSALKKPVSVLDSSQGLFLPSPHHVNPRFRLFPWQSTPDPPSTPLNVFVLNLLSSAASSIYMQTPNITATPVLNAMLSALQRGVNIHIVTSERLMILEQLVTAGTTTARCMKWLIRRYKLLGKKADGADLEAGRELGELLIEYYMPRPNAGKEEPVQSHLKLTIADDNITVLGSGNMDRASWYTSQELGVALLDPAFAATVKNEIKDALNGRTTVFFDSRS